MCCYTICLCDLRECCVLLRVRYCQQLKLNVGGAEVFSPEEGGSVILRNISTNLGSPNGFKTQKTHIDMLQGVLDHTEFICRPMLMIYLHLTPSLTCNRLKT